ncbi:MAG: MATE family efflux transporter [Bacteroidaceae bacterium]|nr:MATE family efflux transporter [Bacteroidaceae bacterium]
MKFIEKKDQLLQRIREHDCLDGRQQLNLAFILSLPSMLAQASYILMEYIDASMVGSLGAHASAAIGLVSTTIWLFGGLTHSASTGFYVQVAHRIGAGEWAEARHVMRQSFISCLSFAMLLSAAGVAISSSLPRWLGGEESLWHDSSMYFLVFSLCLPFSQLNSLAGGMLRSSGNTHIPSLLNILMCLLDVLFNFLLIFPSRHWHGIPLPGAGLGVLGAVLGTAAAYVISSLAMCWFACVRSPELNLFQDSGRFLPTSATLHRAVRIALPMGVEHFIMCAAQIVSTIIVAPLGTVAIAANSFGITVESLCYMPGYGISDAATTLVGQSLGARRSRLARSFGRITLSMGIAIMSVMGVVMYLSAPALMTLMTPDETVRQLTVECLRIEAFAEPMFAASLVAYGIFVGAGDTFVPCTMNLLSIWAVRISLASLLASTMGLRGVWIAMATELCFRGLIFLIRFRSDRWMGLHAEPRGPAGQAAPSSGCYEPSYCSDNYNQINPNTK